MRVMMIMAVLFSKVMDDGGGWGGAPCGVDLVSMSNGIPQWIEAAKAAPQRGWGDTCDAGDPDDPADRAVAGAMMMMAGVGPLVGCSWSASPTVFPNG
jgi:hypothetical protein